jgi:hypothetical protein
MLNPYKTECCVPTTSSTTTSTTTEAEPEYIVYENFARYYSVDEGFQCNEICTDLNTLSNIHLFSATPMGTEPTIGMQLFSDVGLTQQWPITFPNTGWDSVPPTSQYSSFGGGGNAYYGFKVQWGNKIFALVVRGTSWVATENSSPVTSYAVLNFRECPMAGPPYDCMLPS